MQEAPFLLSWMICRNQRADSIFSEEDSIMSLLLDFILVLIFVLCVYTGVKRGFIRSVIEYCGSSAFDIGRC